MSIHTVMRPHPLQMSPHADATAVDTDDSKCGDAYNTPSSRVYETDEMLEQTFSHQYYTPRSTPMSSVASPSISPMSLSPLPLLHAFAYTPIPVERMSRARSIFTHNAHTPPHHVDADSQTRIHVLPPETLSSPSGGQRHTNNGRCLRLSLCQHVQDHMAFYTEPSVSATMSLLFWACTTIGTASGFKLAGPTFFASEWTAYDSIAFVLLVVFMIAAGLIKFVQDLVKSLADRQAINTRQEDIGENADAQNEQHAGDSHPTTANMGIILKPPENVATTEPIRITQESLLIQDRSYHLHSSNNSNEISGRNNNSPGADSKFTYNLRSRNKSHVKLITERVHGC